LNGVNQTAALDSNDDFSTSFDTSALVVASSPYTIGFQYAGDAVFTSASASSTLTVNQAAPSFSGLSAPTITYGTATTTVSGQLDGNAGGQAVPAGETVQVTLNGVNQTAALDSNDDFSTSFDTSALVVASSPYTIGFQYAGDAVFTSASASSTLTVNQAAPSFSGLSAPTMTYGTATTTISGHLDANAGQQAV